MAYGTTAPPNGNANVKGCRSPVDERTSLLAEVDEGAASPGSVAGPFGKERKGSRNGDSEVGSEVGRSESGSVVGVISILLIGVFIANADGSLVLATSGTISSEFNDLESAGWLITSYTLAMCATQSLYGKLSDIYGRKPTIIISHFFFTLGLLISGIGSSLPIVLLGRILAGVGGAGIHVLVSIVIADMVPLRDVASWRSYANIAATTGRSLGGPIGGYLTDTIGWRWTFLGQCPLTLMALVLVWLKLEVPGNDDVCGKQSHKTKLKRVDFLGAVFLSLSIVCGLLVLDLGGQRMQWSDPRILGLLFGSLVAGQIFLLVEAYYAKEPIFPLRLLLKRDVITSYINLGFQTGAQGAMMMLVPIYFQISAHATLTNAGAHLMPSVIGNAIGGLLTGYVIKRTGRYKIVSISGAIASSLCYTLLLARWHGHTSTLESMYIIPGGFGNGIALSAAFIALTADLEPCQMATASSGLYMSSNVGLVAGLGVAEAVLQGSLRKKLRIALEGWEGRDEIIQRSIGDIEFVRNLTGGLGEVVTGVYIRCLAYTHGVSLVGSVVSLIAAICIKEHRL